MLSPLLKTGAALLLFPLAAAAVDGPPASPPPLEDSFGGLFQAIGPVRWGILILAAMLASITLSGLAFLAMPMDKRRDLGASLASMKEWNTVLSTLCTILGPIGTYIGMIGALLAMHQVAIAVDAAAKLAAQAAFFQKAAQMFISSLAGIGIGMSLGMLNNLILHHVLPEHAYPVANQGMVAGSAQILSQRLGKGLSWLQELWSAAGAERRGAKTAAAEPKAN